MFSSVLLVACFLLSLSTINFFWSLICQIIFWPTVTMTAPIKLFQYVQQSYQAMGIHSPQSNRVYTLNPRKLLFLSSLCELFISNLGYFLFKTTISDDYFAHSLYGTICLWIPLALFVINVYQMPTTLQLIRKFDVVIGKSERNRQNLIG